MASYRRYLCQAFSWKKTEQKNYVWLSWKNEAMSYQIKRMVPSSQSLCTNKDASTWCRKMLLWLTYTNTIETGETLSWLMQLWKKSLHYTLCFVLLRKYSRSERSRLCSTGTTARDQKEKVLYAKYQAANEKYINHKKKMCIRYTTS
jgi:hypothetical protein